MCKAKVTIRDVFLLFVLVSLTVGTIARVTPYWYLAIYIATFLLCFGLYRVLISKFGKKSYNEYTASVPTYKKVGACIKYVAVLMFVITLALYVNPIKNVNILKQGIGDTSFLEEAGMVEYSGLLVIVPNFSLETLQCFSVMIGELEGFVPEMNDLKDLKGIIPDEELEIRKTEIKSEIEEFTTKYTVEVEELRNESTVFYILIMCTFGISLLGEIVYRNFFEECKRVVHHIKEKKSTLKYKEG